MRWLGDNYMERNDRSSEVKAKMVELGFTSGQAEALIGCGFVFGPEDVSLVERRELLAAGFTRRDIRKIEVTFPGFGSSVVTRFNS